jgi:serine/threonine-protein kinase
MIGQVLDGKYQITRLLGEGGMGAVYEGTHLGTGRRVAVKVILTPNASATAEMVGRFQREARMAGTVDTEHVVQVFDTGIDRDTGRPFTVMELLRGEDLEKLVERLGPLAPELALRIVAQALLGLKKAHEAGVIHRDIKPANLYLARRDNGTIIVKIVDFGIAKVKGDALGASENQGLTRTGSMMGSPLYMSPEQAQGSKQIDQRTDIWSLGVVLYQVLAGHTPLGHIDTLGALIVALCSSPPPPLQSAAPWIAPEIASIVHAAVEPLLAKRFQSADEMLVAIRALLPRGIDITEAMLVPCSEEERRRVAPVREPPPGAPGLVASQLSMAVSQQASVQAPSAPQPKPKRTWVALPLLAALGAVSFGTYAFLRQHPNAPVVASVPPPTSAPPVPKTEPAPEPSATTTVVAPQERTVKVAILPPTASVEIDGAKAVVADGGIELRGLPGSVHAIKVASGNRETSEVVVVTEGGALPPKVELAAKTAAAPPARVHPEVARPTAPPPSAPAPAKSAGPGLVTTFE